jgi:hypothetical protein
MGSTRGRGASAARIRRTIHERYEPVQKGMLIRRQLPGDLRPGELTRNVYLDCAQTAEAIQSSVKFTDELFVGFCQTVIPF